MTEYEIQEALMAMLRGEETELDGKVYDVRSFSDGGYLTYDKGLVLRTTDGSEFQITIKQSC